jgi:dienelactone hydrolase
MTIAAILGLGVAGNVMEPQWSPRQYDPPPQFTGVVPAPTDTVELADDFTRDDVTVETADESLDGVVYSPTEPGRYPAVIFVHGAGTKDATEFAEQAAHLARAGIVSLVFDKRQNGYSTWHRDYEMMAGDTLAGVDLLRDRPDVDPAQVGLFGESEGTWIAPVAAAQDPSIAFMIMVSAPIVPPSQQATYATLMSLDGLDAPDTVDRAVAKGIGMATSVPNLLEYADFDVLPAIAASPQPMLMVFGAEDYAVPIIQAAELTMAAAAQPPQADVTVRYFANAQHGIRIGDIQGPFVPGYLDLLATWITDTTSGGYEGPAVAGGQPTQTLSAEAVPAAPWYATAHTHAAVFLLAIAGFLAGPVTALVLRWRRGARAPRMLPARRRSVRWLRFFGLASLVTLVGYFVGLSHLALNHLTNPLLTYGGWALVWLVTAGAVTALVSVLHRGKAWRPGGLEVVGVDDAAIARPNKLELIALAGAAGGTILLLLVVTYWGVFLGI